MFVSHDNRCDPQTSQAKCQFGEVGAKCTIVRCDVESNAMILAWIMEREAAEPVWHINFGFIDHKFKININFGYYHPSMLTVLYSFPGISLFPRLLPVLYT